jgi:hypothetical protein
MLKVFAITLAVMELYGVFLRGGQGQPSYWQLIHPVSLVLASAAMLYSIRGPRDFRALGTIIVVSAVTKGLLVAWVYEVVCRPMNIRPFYATTHSDSVTFAMGITCRRQRLRAQGQEELPFAPRFSSLSSFLPSS